MQISRKRLKKTAGDTTRSVVISRDPKGQGYADIFGYKYLEEC